MVLFFFDSIIKIKYKKFLSNNLDKNKNITLSEFKKSATKQILKIFPLYFLNINEKYIENILLDQNNYIVFYCMDVNFLLSNITSILIYHKIKIKELIKYYILLLGTHYKFRNVGYGKLILDEFIIWIKLSNTKNNKTKLILKSVKSSMDFYLSYGFVQSNISNSNSNRLFYKYEPKLVKNYKYILELIFN